MPAVQWMIHTFGWMLLCGFGITFLLMLVAKTGDCTHDGFWGGVILFGAVALAVRCLLY